MPTEKLLCAKCTKPLAFIESELVIEELSALCVSCFEKLRKISIAEEN